MNDKEIENGFYSVGALFFMSGLTKSRAEAKRISVSGGLKINGAVVLDTFMMITLDPKQELLLEIEEKKSRKIIGK